MGLKVYNVIKKRKLIQDIYSYQITSMQCKNHTRTVKLKDFKAVSVCDFDENSFNED